MKTTKQRATKNGNSKQLESRKVMRDKTNIKTAKPELVHGKFCCETQDGGVEIRVGDIRHKLDPGMFFDSGASLSFAADEIRDQPWLTAEVKAELFDIAASRARLAMLQEWADAVAATDKSVPNPPPEVTQPEQNFK